MINKVEYKEFKNMVGIEEYINKKDVKIQKIIKNVSSGSIREVYRIYREREEIIEEEEMEK